MLTRRGDVTLRLHDSVTLDTANANIYLEVEVRMADEANWEEWLFSQPAFHKWAKGLRIEHDGIPNHDDLVLRIAKLILEALDALNIAFLLHKVTIHRGNAALFTHYY